MSEEPIRMATPRAAQNGTFQRVSRSTREDVIGGSYDSTASNGRRAAARRTGGRLLVPFMLSTGPVYVIYWSRLCYLRSAGASSPERRNHDQECVRTAVSYTHLTLPTSDLV